MPDDIESLISEPPQQEQRQFARRDVKWQAAIKDKKRNLIVDAITLNVSEQGALIATYEPFKKSLLIPLMIKARVQDKSLVIYVMAEVRHVVIKKDSFELGLLFKQIRPADQQFLARFAEGGI
ncbi:PilZ domain-containing protein [Spartinivicinus ruber]|uniref:PilZ domain-containing protein n=1 Tax=Spartinivicinus ruber TaxID=2683272 RepID=UPI0013D86D04|nr:PilZ domain-containing protein [Spartinivicinus ruber]